MKRFVMFSIACCLLGVTVTAFADSYLSVLIALVTGLL